MERLTERLETTRRALVSFEEILAEPKSRIVRDASIHRFEYTFEACWKTAKLFLKHHEGTDINSPKSAVRTSFQIGLLDEPEARLGIAMADDRNLTVHTYNEDLAEEIYGRLASYSGLMNSWLEAMKRRLQEID